jgi:microcystin-dependent protein
MQANEITIEIRDKTLTRRGQINPEFLDLKATNPHLGIGAWTLTLPNEHAMVPYLNTPGSGVIISARGKTFLSGPTLNPASSASPEDPGGLTKFTGVSDEVILWHALAIPDPNHAVDAQLLGYDVRSGVAETVMRAYVNANVGPGALISRRGLLAQKLTLAPDLARGPVVSKSARFPRLGDLLAEIAVYADMGFRVVQVGAALEFQVYEIQDRTKFVRFDIQNGTLSEQSVERSAPAVTRVYVAGQGDLAARVIVPRTSVDSLAAEDAWGFKIERFKDQRQTDVLLELQQAGDEDLAADGFTATSVKAIPADETTMLYGKDWENGDSVTVVIDEQETVSTVTQVALVANKSGAMIGAAIGDVTGFDADAAIAARVEDTERRVGALERNSEQAIPDAPNAYPGWDPGDLKLTSRNTAPAGWLFANGAAVSRTTYADLYAAIGTTSGVGNGSTTFNVPDLRDKVPMGAGGAYVRGELGGANSHVQTEAEMANHTHAQAAHNHTQDSHNHAITGTITPAIVQTAAADGSNPNRFHLANGVAGLSATAKVATNQATTATNAWVGGNVAMSLVQAFTAVNYLIKT